jgi:hypothetical protein
LLRVLLIWNGAVPTGSGILAQRGVLRWRDADAIRLFITVGTAHAAVFVAGTSRAHQRHVYSAISAPAPALGARPTIALARHG